MADDAAPVGEYVGFKKLVDEKMARGAKRVDFHGIHGRASGRFRKVRDTEGRPRCVKQAKYDIRNRRLHVRLRPQVDVSVFRMHGCEWSLAEAESMGKATYRWLVADAQFADIMDGLAKGAFCK